MFKINLLKNQNKIITNTLKIKQKSNLLFTNLFNFSEQNIESNSRSKVYSRVENNDQDLLMLSKQEKVFSKVLLRNIKYYSKPSLSSEAAQNLLHNSVSNRLINTFNFSEENQEIGNNQHYLMEENNSESDLIYSTSKSFFVDWANSNPSQGKFTLHIKSQSKNIIFEDLFNSLQNIKDENSLFVVNFDGRSSQDADEHDLLSDSEDAVNRSRNLLDFPRDMLDEVNKDRRKFDLVYQFDRNKPNQLLFFCEKLFVNDIISAEELSEIKRLAFVSNRNLKYSQDQNRMENQYDSVTEALGDIRIMEKLERLHEANDVKVAFDLNLLFWRADHKIDTKITMPKSIENKFIYVISDKNNVEFLSKVPGISKLDSGEYFEEFLNMIDKNTYNKKYKLFIAKNNLELITQKAEIYERFEEKAPGFQNHIRNNEEEIVAEVTDVQENRVNVKLGKDNKIYINLGDLSLGDDNLLENFAFLRKQILKLKPQSVNKKNYIKNVSIFVNNVEFRLKNKE